MTQTRSIWPSGSLSSALLQQANSSSARHSNADPSVPLSGLGAFIANSQHHADANLTSVKFASFNTQVTRPSAHYLTRSQVQLVRSTRLVLSGQASVVAKSLSPLETLYRMADHVVAYSTEDELYDLYDTIKIEIERASGAQASNLKATGSSETSLESQMSWLSKLEASWSTWCHNVSLVRDILLPLDLWIANHPRHGQESRLVISDLALNEFGHRLLQDDVLAQMILNNVIAGINAHRKGLLSCESMYTAVIKMFDRLQARSLLDQAIERATVTFYQSESTERIASLSTADYLVYAKDRISQELESTPWCRSTREGDVVIGVAAETQIVAEHVPALLAGLPELLDNRRMKSLSLMYDLIARVGKHSELRKCFSDYIKLRGEAVVNDKAKDENMIERLLEFKGLIDSVVQDCFAQLQEFVNAKKESFEVFINRREDKPAELIAKFLDAKLRSGNKTMSDAELEHNLDEALTLFRYTHAKDMFEEFYKRYFAKRLLLNRSASSDAEKSMLLKLKEECGPGFTAKLETMIKDVEVSKDLMDEYERYVAKQAKQDVDEAQAGTEDASELDPSGVNVSVLTQAHWPTYPQLDVVLPKELSTAADLFTKFYQTRNSGRRLHWQHSLGTLSLHTFFPKAGAKELQVSTFQGIVLMLFNSLESGQKLSYSSIKAATGLDDKELKRTLQSLACGQIPTRVLRKLPQGKDVDDSDEFIFNDNFKNERHRIRINQIQMKETAEEQKSTEQRVFLDRDLILQAAAVRVLKAKKTIKHSELVTEVVDQIKSRFAIEVSEIKKVFEILIEKEYMERVEGERGMYRYLA